MPDLFQRRISTLLDCSYLDSIAMLRVWFSFWDGLFGSSFSLSLFCWPFVVSIVYVLYTLYFLVNILLFIDQKKKKFPLVFTFPNLFLLTVSKGAKVADLWIALEG